MKRLRIATVRRSGSQCRVNNLYPLSIARETGGNRNAAGKSNPWRAAGGQNAKVQRETATACQIQSYCTGTGGNRGCGPLNVKGRMFVKLLRTDSTPQRDLTIASAVNPIES